MILGRVNGINANGVGFERNQIRNVDFASVGIGERINIGGVGGNCTSCTNLLLIGDTLEEELGSIGKEELGALE